FPEHVTRKIKRAANKKARRRASRSDYRPVESLSEIRGRCRVETGTTRGLAERLGREACRRARNGERLDMCGETAKGLEKSGRVFRVEHAADQHQRSRFGGAVPLREVGHRFGNR